MEPLREKIKRLAELPVEAFEVAGKLGFSEKMPGITIDTNFVPLRSLKSSLLLIPNKSQYSILVREEESCSFYVPTSWLLYIVEIPQVFLSWYGLWNDIPPYPSLQVIMGTLALFDQSHLCCPGYQYCPPTGSCIPLQIKCQDTFPA
jgi:hypothetical protein